MLVHCTYSGLSYECSLGFVYTGVYANQPHPMFSLKASQLIGLLEYTPEAGYDSPECYLLGLALLSKLPSQWKHPVTESLARPHVVANLERIAKAVEKIDLRYYRDLPTIIIDKSTADLEQLPNWLDAVEQAFSDATNTSAAFRRDKKSARIESVVESLIRKGFTRNQSRIAKVIAEWASVAGDFPAHLKEDWIEMIRQAFNDDLLSVLSGDSDAEQWEFMVEHCAFTLPHGSTHCAILMKKINTALDIVKEFCAPQTTARIVRRLSKLEVEDIGEIEEVEEVEELVGSAVGYTTMQAATTTPSTVTATAATYLVTVLDGEVTEIIPALVPAPVTTKPNRTDYPSALTYTRALLNWKKQNA